MTISTINWSNITTPTQILYAANTNTNGLFWPIGYYTFILVLFLSLLGFGPEIAGLVALFIAIIPGVMLVYLGLISLTVLGIPIGILLFLMIYIIYSSQKTQ